MDTLFYVLTSISGISWTIVYLAVIYRGFKDRTYGIPFFALALNIAWEFLFSFLFGGQWSLQKVINVTWFFFDVVILYTYFRYGRKEFPKTIDQKWFVPWSWLAIAVGLATQYFAALEFPGLFGPTYPAFVINLVMSILFIDASPFSSGWALLPQRSCSTCTWAATWSWPWGFLSLCST